jgi:NAD-dependent deacetylase
LFAAIGTSGQVYPAAGFVDFLRQRGRAHTIEINLAPLHEPSPFHERRTGRATELVPAWVDELLADNP